MIFKEQELRQIDDTFILGLWEQDPIAVVGLCSKLVRYSPKPEKPKEAEQKKPGRQPGSPGFGRTQQLPITGTTHHHCGCCSACNDDLSSVEKAYTGFQTVDVTFGTTDKPGLQLTVTLNLLATNFQTGQKAGINHRFLISLADDKK